jgi:DNA-binding IscR family transcriptional regulator
MARNARFSVALHLLAHMANARGPRSSEDLAGCIGTNPVVVRRTLAGLREAGIVSSSRGAGGGWLLSRRPAAISLRDVYLALGDRLLQGIDVTGTAAGRRHGRCSIQRAVAGRLDEFMEDAEALLAARLGGITLEEIACARTKQS